MSGQVNVRLSPEEDAEFDQWRTELGVERGTLGRDILREALAARREGRASFDRPEPLGPGDLAGMRAMLVEGLMEIKRIATDWAKHLSWVRKQEREGQEALTRARTEYIAGIPERIAGSLNPIREEMDALIERVAACLDGIVGRMDALATRIENHPGLDAIAAGQVEHTAALNANTAAIVQLRKEPRTHTTYDLGLGHWNGKAWSIVLGVLWVLSVALFFGLALILPASVLAVRSANLLLGGGDQAICALVDYRHSTDTCKTRVNGRDVGVSINVPAPKRERRR